MAGTSVLRIVLGAGTGIALVATTAVLWPHFAPPDAPPADAALPAEVALATNGPGNAGAGTTGDGAADRSSLDRPAPDPETAEEVTVAAVQLPSFDVVRIDPDGSGLVAGRAAAGATVSIILDDETLVEVTTDAAGRFVQFISLGSSNKPRVLSLLTSQGGDVQMSDATVIVAPNAVALAQMPPEPGATADAAQPGGVATDAAGDITARADADQEATPDAVTAAAGGRADATPPPDASVNAEAPAGEAEVAAADAPARPPVLMADADGVRVLQPAIAPDASPEVLSSVALDTITYDTGGDVSLSGRATGEGFVNVYINNRRISSAQISVDGVWESDLPEFSTGVYTLRVDQVDTDGNVLSRIETPFLREERDSVAAAIADETGGSFQVAMKTVQPGATLWAIARERYGEGVLYVQVFEANRDRIRNPDLIYPGQVFQLPEIGRALPGIASDP